MLPKTVRLQDRIDRQREERDIQESHGCQRRVAICDRLIAQMEAELGPGSTLGYSPRGVSGANQQSFREICAR